MWTYLQSTGELLHDDKHVAFGYSGAPGAAKNNPSMQNVHNTGPIPRGIYEIGEPEDTQAHGPFVLPLTPHADNQMFGRAGFLIHGDSIQHPGTASQGCIILARLFRLRIAQSGDQHLLVKDIEQPMIASDVDGNLSV